MARFSRRASNSAPRGASSPCPESEIKGDFRGISPTKRFRTEMEETDDFGHHLDKGVQPQQAHEGGAKDPTPNNA
jgi:hypothetical protein